MSLPICISAKILNLKVILFEPNLVLGRSNLFFLNYCSSILCYSEEIRNFPIKFKRKINIKIKIMMTPNSSDITETI